MDAMTKFKLESKRGVGNATAKLYVRNVTGIGEEVGWRLFWSNDGGNILCPESGYATSNPFFTCGNAIATGKMRHGEIAKLLS